MITHLLDEPELEFGQGGRHVDIRYGLLEYGVLDQDLPTAPRTIAMGIVGTAETCELLRSWIEECRHGVEAKSTELATLFPAFPGFASDKPFFSSVTTEERFRRVIPRSRLSELLALEDATELARSAVDLVLAEVEHLAEHATPAVIVCAMPTPLRERLQTLRQQARNRRAFPPDFHDMLKARALRLRVPLQLIWQSTLERGRSKQSPSDGHKLQDRATRAWNLHAALYYKAGGIPYRLPRDSTALDSCFIGISFYNTLDRQETLTSVAQVFDQRGEGVIVRGGRAERNLRDRQVHLAAERMYSLIHTALEVYRGEHRNLPARVVVHKTSSFNDAEREGARSALSAHRVDVADLVSIRDSTLRLFRFGNHPPLRGTLLVLDEQSQLLYTRGSVPFYRTYPGMYVPRTLRVECDQIESTPMAIAKEILALSKLNFNDTQLDGSAPMTVRASRHVGAILKYVAEDESPPASFKYYM